MIIPASSLKTTDAVWVESGKEGIKKKGSRCLSLRKCGNAFVHGKSTSINKTVCGTTAKACSWLGEA